MFRYDFFEELFNNIYIGQLLLGKVSIDENLLRTMKRYYRINTIFMQDCVVRIKGLSDEVIINMLSVLEKITAKYSERRDLEEVKAKAVAMIFNVSLQYLLTKQQNTIENNTDMFNIFFKEGNDTEVRGLSLCGITYNNSPKIVFNFSDTRFEDCYLEEYDYFWECRFNKKTLFKKSKFIALGKKEDINSQAKLNNFELHSCYLVSRFRNSANYFGILSLTISKNLKLRS